MSDFLKKNIEGHKTQEAQTTKTSINGSMGKQSMEYTYYGVLLSHKKESNSDTYYSMGNL